MVRDNGQGYSMTSSTQGIIASLGAIFGDRISTGESVLVQHSHDEAYNAPALPDAVVFPETAAEISELLKFCNKHKVPVVPYGIGSSLEGHVIPVQGGISVDTSRMNKVLSIHESDMDVVVQPGVTRKQLNTELRATGLMFTVDPGADATLGGMAATRASGTNTVRYGSMRENVLALEVVLADGRIIRTGTRARKSSAGYDLTRLFVGSEGTLGIITELTVRLYGQPEAVSAATCVFETVDDAVNTVINAIQMGIPLARVELLDEVQMKGMNLYTPDFEMPEKPHLFIEFHGTDSSVKEQTELFDEVGQDNGMSDFRWATVEEDRNKLWQARHNAYYAGKALRSGANGVVTDVCVPLSRLSECIGRTKLLIAESGMIAPLVGHVGDGNFHLLILIDPDNENELKQAKTLAGQVNELALEMDGTVTGEHGVGSGKMKYMRDEHGAAVDVMSTLKKSLDPENIMNPGKLISVN